MEKVYSPREIEPRIYERWEAIRLVRAAGRGPSLLHRHPAAECDRHAAHGARVPAHADGRADPLASHGRRRHALAARHRSRRHRHADGRRAPAQRRGHVARTISGARRSSSASGSGRSSPEAPSRGRCAASATRVDWSRDRFTMDPGLSPRSRKYSCACTKRDSSIAASAW